MSDRYDRMTDEEIRRQAAVRGIPKYKTDLFVGNALRGLAHKGPIQAETGRVLVQEREFLCRGQRGAQ